MYHFQSSFGQQEALGKVSDSFTFRKAASLRLFPTEFNRFSPGSNHGFMCKYEYFLVIVT